MLICIAQLQVACVWPCLPRERMCGGAVFIVFWPGLEKGDGLTALPKQSSVMYIQCTCTFKYFERENVKSKNRGPLKFTFKMAKATSYSDRTGCPAHSVHLVS